MLHLILSLLIPTFAGVAVVVALVSGFTAPSLLIGAAGAGAIVAIPAGIILARLLKSL
jgi:hypothetical protein